MTDVQPVPPGVVAHVQDRDITRLARDVSRRLGIFHSNCLDIGCGRSRHDIWFQRFERSEGDRRYTAVDADPEIVKELRAAGVHACLPGEVGSSSADLALCLEVVEHIPEEEIPAFLQFVESKTRKLAVFTTPNLEYWDVSAPGNARAKAEIEGLRWIPDHVLTLTDDATDPHGHKQVYTPERLRTQLEAAFPARTWGIEIYRAWPWTIGDVPNGRTHVLYFKIFAVAWRRTSP